jgi:hypothetical protein
MENMGNSIEELLKTINQTLRELSTCKDIDQKKNLAETVKLLCDSLGVFFDAMGIGGGLGVLDDFDDDYDDDDDDYSDDDEVVDFRSLKKKNRKKKKNKDIPF